MLKHQYTYDLQVSHQQAFCVLPGTYKLGVRHEFKRYSNTTADAVYVTEIKA